MDIAEKTKTILKSVSTPTLTTVLLKKGLRKVAAEAAEQERTEEWIMQQVDKGTPLPGLYPMNEETRKRYDAEKADSASSRQG